LFVKAGCGHCHVLSDARTHGAAGPDFDTSERLDRAQLLQGMIEGANGMPSYARRLTAQQRGALADYLLRVAWGRGGGIRPSGRRAAGR
jgi:mono/diheme cytochrome c family protein